MKNCLVGGYSWAWSETMGCHWVAAPSRPMNNCLSDSYSYFCVKKLIAEFS